MSATVREARSHLIETGQRDGSFWIACKMPERNPCGVDHVAHGHGSDDGRFILGFVMTRRRPLDKVSSPRDCHDNGPGQGRRARTSRHSMRGWFSPIGIAIHPATIRMRRSCLEGRIGDASSAEKERACLRPFSLSCCRVKHLQTALRAAVRDKRRRIREISLLSPVERETLLEAFNARAQELDPTPFILQFEREAGSCAERHAPTASGRRPAHDHGNCARPKGSARC